MKKISKGYWILAAALVLWAAVDFYHYIAVGQDIIAHYAANGSVLQLVRSTLVQGIVKTALALLVLLTGWLRARAKQPVSAAAALTGLLSLAVGLTWAVSMGCLTVVLAQDMYDDLFAASYAFPEDIELYSGLYRFYDSTSGLCGRQQEYQDLLQHNMLEAIAGGTNRSYYNAGNYGTFRGDRSKLVREIACPMETAVLFYDGSGQLLFSSQDDIMFFDYYTQDEWDAGMDSSAGLHYGWMDISEGENAENWEDDPYLRFRTMFAGIHSLRDIAALRVTGVFEGNELKPVAMHYVTDGQVWQAVESTDQFSTEDGYTYILSDVDRTGLLDWQLQFERPSEYKEDELVTVYLQNPEMWDYEGETLTYGGKIYENLADLAESQDFPSWSDLYLYSEDFRAQSSYELDNLLVFGGWERADYEGTDSSESGSTPDADFILITAVRSNPLACAASALRNIYIVTGLLALLLVLLVRKCVKSRLIQPVADVAEAAERDWRRYRTEDTPKMWREALRLDAAFAAEQDRRRMKDNEIARLSTALGYAKAAEENRRQMTSNIAHELKTPLAVIHSYAEGLREQIAPEKREKYLDVILAESERTDAMVLEMLDLSRLEAGKVKLSRDEFSLTQLTKAVFEKLELAAQAKKLQISFDCPDEYRVIADESRIAQVVENFASNAVKYTPDGGSISVRISAAGGKTTFAIANDCPPLSDEALSRVWDTFYRTDEARSGGGTGLGLAIAKSIVDLHGGACEVHNTKTGVEFLFTL